MTRTTLVTADDHRLAARWWNGDGRTREAVVLVHGFSGTKDDPALVALAERLVESNRAVLTYDSRGHGDSDGLCTLGDLECLDVASAVDAARDRADDVILVGVSMGGIAVINHLAEAGPENRTTSGAVIVATPARWELPRSTRGVLTTLLTQTRLGRRVASRRLGTRVAKRSTRGRPPVERIAACGRPIALVHGRDDRFLPPETARVLYDALPPPRYLDLVPGMGHGFDGASTGPIATAVDWVSRHTGDRAT